LLAVAGVLAGCPAAPLPEDQYVAAVTLAAREERSNRYGAASAGFERAAGLTADEQVARSALYRAAITAEQAGESVRAMGLYLAVAERGPGTQEAGRALYDAGRLAEEEGRVDEAIALWRRLIRDEPASAMAEVAVRWLYQVHEERGDGAGFEALVGEELGRGMERDVDLVSALLLWRARARAAQGRTREAEADLELALERCTYPYCVWWDDLPWEGAQIARDEGDYRGALEWIDRLLFWKEECWFFNGSFYSAYFDDAQRLKAELLRDELGDAAGAAAAFLDLEEFTDSVLRDDGLYEAAELFLGELGEPGRGCEALRDLVEDYPDSNRRRAAEERLGQPPCVE
jgi:tetratricopeptide (TPR) repeat protein